MKRLLILLLFAMPAYGQVSVSLSPEPKLQFLSNNGVPLAGGCVFTYAAGTSTPQASYIDSTGTATNTNPVILDAGGRASIWLTSQGYKLTLFTAGGVNCASGSQIWSVDGITGQLGLLSLANTWSGVQTFSQPIKITPSVNQLVLGTSPNTTTINAPAPAGAITITLPTVTSTLAPLSGGTFTNTTLTSPTIVTPTVGGILNQNGPGTYMIATNTGAGTTLGTLTKLNSSGALIAAITDTGGVVGIAVAGAGASGTVTIQQSGSLNCVFDNTTTLGDYIQISPTVAGDCHDTGATYPTSGQVIGRVLLTQGIIATAPISLFGPEIRSPSVASAVNLTAQGANIASTPIFTPAANGFYRFNCYMVVTQAATSTSTLPQCNVLFTDADSSVSETVVITNVNSANTLGALGTSAVGTNGVIYAKSGVSNSYSTSSYATSGATSMLYAVRIRVEGPL